ncbi:MAG: DUF1722 domain-containing protein [Gammaproteobacteria bacterium]|nr:DUF1722 domain-containing protein [Gammaproteobacteria bacterium]MCW8923850.1 DUF1722 domain-containing protein [Gammaproteobacteria bacterium]
MRIWDIDPGYLNRQSLLGEHRELHGIVSIIANNKKGYSRHPETLRWVGYGWALKQRHKLLAAEMQLRGYTDHSPVLLRSKPTQWPARYIDPPATQLSILADKYRNLEPGRIPLPRNAQQLWAQHKYSVMARSIAEYERIGKWVARKQGAKKIDEVALELNTLLRQPPNPKLIENTLLHMWGYVSKYALFNSKKINAMSKNKLLTTVRQLALSNNVSYIKESTAIGELGGWA